MPLSSMMRSAWPLFNGIPDIPADPGTVAIAWESNPPVEAGKVATALKAKADDLLAIPPMIENADVLASKLPVPGAASRSRKKAA